MHTLKSKVFFKIIGFLTLIEGIALLPCIFAATKYDDKSTASSLFMISIIYIFIGYNLTTRLRGRKFKLRSHEGYFISTLCWVYCSLIGALPFYFGVAHYTFPEALFEATAGFTTTGCTSFDLNLMPKSLLLWRAISNWLGGMGILVLVVSFLPALGIDGQNMAATETTGPTIEKVGGKFSDTGKFLYFTYTAFTVVELILLSLSPLSFFDALINTFSSISTGGLLVINSNAHLFAGAYVRLVIIVFTILSSMNYTLYFFLINGRKKVFTGNAEVKGFWLIILAATFLISADLMISSRYTSFYHALKDSLFQVISFISTSGYYVSDYTSWPTFSVAVLFILLLIGGCSMSTSGSLKVIRVMILFKMIFRGIFRAIHPNSVKAVKIAGKPVSAKRAGEITTHILLYAIVLMFSFVVLSLNNFDMETTITTAIGIFTNTGMALGEPGSSGYFGMFNDFSLFYMSLLMICGRLEMWAVVMLFTKTFWFENKPNRF